jgi:hypothetical protein
MLKIIQKIGNVLRHPYDPNPHRRAEVIRFLAQRPVRSHEEWHRDFAEAQGIPLSFVIWYRDTCSKNFEYDLSAALPDDRLREDLGMFDATWGDVDLDIVEDYESHYGVKLITHPPQPITTFGQMMSGLWSQLPREP